jgi:hypothetical protein
MAWPQTGCAAPAHVWLRGLHQGNNTTPAQAGRSWNKGCLHWLRERAKVWRFYNPASGRAIVSRDVIFNEQAPWNWENLSQDGGGIGIEYHTLELGEPQDAPIHATSTTTMPAALSPEATMPVHTVTPAPTSPPPQPEFVSPPPNAEDYLDIDADGIEHRYRRIHDILGAATPPG